MDIHTEKIAKRNNASYWIYFFRQFFSCSITVMYFFICGMYTGAPTVIIPQLRKEANSTDAVSPEMASWLSSICAYCAVPGSIILPILSYRFGRKILLILVSLITLVGNILFYYSTHIEELLISLALQGIPFASLMTLSLMVISEYTSPKYRGVLLVFKSATFFWGIWVSNAIGTFFHWRNISIVLFFCCFYNLLSIFCCESPYWLATKGRFDECAKNHRWLKGTDKDSEEELLKLILSQKEHLNYKASHNPIKSWQIVKILRVLQNRSFYKPLVYSLLLVCLYHFSGKIAYTVYAIDVIKNVTGSEKAAYNGMLILDGVTVLGMYIGCGLAKILTRRTQLILFSSIGICFLYILSVYLYMIYFNIISENKYVSLFFLTGFSMGISCGPMCLSTSCSAELSPLRYRSYFFCYLTIFTDMILGTALNISPRVFKLLGTQGAFLFFGLSSTIFLLLLYMYLPETKDKTIQEIQDIISKGDRCSAVLSGDLELLALNETKQ